MRVYKIIFNTIIIMGLISTFLLIIKNGVSVNYLKLIATFFLFKEVRCRVFKLFDIDYKVNKWGVIK